MCACPCRMREWVSTLKSVDKLFEAFYTTKSDGMGIGLSVSRSIIESHHGRLWAAPNDGPGATFSFSIPCEPEAVDGAPEVLAPFERLQRTVAARHEASLMVIPFTRVGRR